MPTTRQAEAKPGTGLAGFLKQALVKEGLSREEAAARVGISEGYLCHLLAGNVRMPHPNKFKRMAANWNFSRIDALAAMGLIEECDIRHYIAEQRAADVQISTKMQNLIERISEFPPHKQDRVITLFLDQIALMSTFNE